MSTIKKAALALADTHPEIAAELTKKAEATEVTAFDKSWARDLAKEISQGVKALRTSDNYEEALAYMADIIESMGDFVEELNLSRKRKLIAALRKAALETGEISMEVDLTDVSRASST